MNAMAKLSYHSLSHLCYTTLLQFSKKIQIKDEFQLNFIRKYFSRRKDEN